MQAKPKQSKIKKTHDRDRTARFQQRNAEAVTRLRNAPAREVSLCRCRDCGTVYNSYEGHEC